MPCPAQLMLSRPVLALSPRFADLVVFLLMKLRLGPGVTIDRFLASGRSTPRKGLSKRNKHQNV